MRVHRLLPLFLVLWVGLSACTGAEGDVERADGGALADAVAATQAAESARMSMSMETSTPGFSFGMAGDGVVLLDGSQGEFTMTMTGDAAGIVEDSEIRIVDGTQYIRGGAVQQYVTAGVAPDGTEWVALPLPEIATALTGPNLADIGGQLDLLREIEAEVETLADADIDGVSYHHVRAQLSMADQLEAADVSMEELLGDQPGSAGLLEGDGAATLEAAADEVVYDYDVYYDDDGLIRRVTATANLGPMMEALSPPGAAAGMAEATMTMQMDFTDYGVDVDVQAPSGDVHRVD